MYKVTTLEELKQFFEKNGFSRDEGRTLLTCDVGPVRSDEATNDIIGVRIEPVDVTGGVVLLAPRQVPPGDAEAMARMMHENIERFCIKFGYSAGRVAIRPWEEAPLMHRKVMVAVCGALLTEYKPE